MNSEAPSDSINCLLVFVLVGHIIYDHNNNILSIILIMHNFMTAKRRILPTVSWWNMRRPEASMG